MDLELNETQALLFDTVQQFLEQEVPFDRIRELERERRGDTALWKAICEQGWLGVAVGEAFGGAGGTWVDLGLVVEAIARRAAIVPILEVAACVGVIERHASADAAARLVPGVLAGSDVVVPAILEDEDRLDTCTARVGADGSVRGHKSFVDHAQMATHHLVRAVGEAGEVLVLVDAQAAGVEMTPISTIGRTPTARVTYADAPGEIVAEGAAAVPALLLLGRALATVQIVGAMAAALEGAIDYAKVREQFGKPIGSFQAVRHHGANMASRVASARLLAFEALSTMDAGRPAERIVAAAKASASRAAPEVTMLAHQIFGGNGVIEENDHYFFTLRARERASAWGTVDECLAVLADDVRADNDWL